MTLRYTFADPGYTLDRPSLSPPRGPQEDRSTAQGKGVASGLAIGFFAGIAIVLLAPEEGAAAVITVIAGSTFVGGAAGYAGVVLGQSTSDSSGGTSANQNAGNQDTGNQGSGDQGSTNDSGGGVGGSGGCFPAGTPVLLADGSFRSIEAIKEGDLVVSQDFDTGHVSGQPVLKVFRHQVSSMLGLQFTDGTSLETTATHRFFVPEEGFVAAGSLRPGSVVVTHDNQYPAVSTTHSVDAAASVYNLEIAHSHTYFVGKQGIWVHNVKIEDPGE